MSFIATFFEILFQILALAIFVRAIMSWFPTSSGNQLIAFVYQITEPILAPLRRIIPPIGGTIDITPMIAMVVLMFASRFAAGLG